MPQPKLDNLTIFWAKLAERGEAAGYHPLICHMLDVAAVTEAMWDEVLSGAARRDLAIALGFADDPVTARVWVAFLAGLHDLGKCSPSFAFKAAAIELHGWYEALDADCHRRLPNGPIELPVGSKELPHGVITAATLPELLTQQFGVDEPVARTLANLTGGHHGTFEVDAKGHLKNNSISVGRGLWPDARLRLALLLADALGVPKDKPQARPDAGAALALAGYISVADWIGSNDDEEKGFPHLQDSLVPVANFDPANYLEGSRARAGRALAWAGWTGWHQPALAATFWNLFRLEPNALQLATVALAEQIAAHGEPGLVIIEAPMGEGKTEAAFYLADRWGVGDGPRGIYIGLPTMATSNQMFTRLQKFLAQRYSADAVNVQLLHGRASLLDEIQALRDRAHELFVPVEIYGEDSHSGIAAAGWFAAPKRGLLAPFAAGTVDQLLLTGLKTRHVAVRLFGVHRKTVIVDEVHAYDTYMSTLLEGVLRWLGALGSPVILLSATLTANKRQSLLDAYREGLGFAKAPAEAVPDTPYPRLSWATPSSQDCRGIDAARMRHKSLLVSLIDDAMPHDDGSCRLAGLLQKRLQEGGCIAVVCNTVRRAQVMYDALRHYFPDEDGGPIVRLFHARYRFKERSENERRVLRAFGKPDTGGTNPDGDPTQVERPRKAILVATQVIEQSLDLDFDLMVSDFAPADLLLQRAGRLQRHDRGARPGFLKPELWLIGPEAYDGSLPGFDRGSRYVYAPYVLLRSWLSLAQRALLGTDGGVIVLPDDIQGIIEDVYGDDEPRRLPDGHWEAELAKSKAALEKQMGKEVLEANMRWTPKPGGELSGQLHLMTRDFVREDQPDVHVQWQALTRLAPLAVTLVLLLPDEQEEAARLTAAWLQARREYGRFRRSASAPGEERRRGKDRLDAERRKARRQLEVFMLERAIEVTHYDVVGHWRSQKHPDYWQDSPALSHAWRVDLVESDGAMRYLGGGPLLTLDENSGLKVTPVQR